MPRMLLIFFPYVGVAALVSLCGIGWSFCLFSSHFVTSYVSSGQVLTVLRPVLLNKMDSALCKPCGSQPGQACVITWLNYVFKGR